MAEPLSPFRADCFNAKQRFDRQIIGGADRAGAEKIDLRYECLNR